MAVVAALPSKDSLQVQGEAGSPGSGGGLDAEGALRRKAAEFGGQPGLATGQGNHLPPVIHPAQPGIRQGETGLSGEIPLHPVAVPAGEQELLRGTAASQGDGPGLKREGKKYRGGCGFDVAWCLCGLGRFLFRMAWLCSRHHQCEQGQPEGRLGSAMISIVVAGSFHWIVAANGRPILRLASLGSGASGSGLRSMRLARPPAVDFRPGPSNAPCPRAEAPPSSPKPRGGPGCEECGAGGWPERLQRPRS